MEYKSFADLAQAVAYGAYKIPKDVDLIVGIPRSGCIPANMLASQLNLPYQDLGAFLANEKHTVGWTAQQTMPPREKPHNVLFVDDSILSGKSMRDARAQIQKARLDIKPIYLAIYGDTQYHPDADIILEVVPTPRIFQWNLVRHKRLAEACVDIDGVLCHDPSDQENDDGARYVEFLLSARPLFPTKRKVGHLVTSRLEKYRAETEQWLAKHGIEYEKLWMLDLPSAEERRRLGAHSTHKAEVFKKTDSSLFIESEYTQAVKIADLSGKPVLCIETHEMIWPAHMSKRSHRRYQDRLRNKGNSRLKRLLRAAALFVIGPKNMNAVRKKVRHFKEKMAS